MSGVIILGSFDSRLVALLPCASLRMTDRVTIWWSKPKGPPTCGCFRLRFQRPQSSLRDSENLCIVPSDESLGYDQVALLRARQGPLLIDWPYGQDGTLL